jgi:putative transposase
MSLHSYTRCWVHLIWAAHKREKMLHKEARVKVSGFLREYAEAKNIYMRTNFVNADHVHAVIDLPTGMDIEEAVKLLKGSSSHWINKNRAVPGKFSWGRGYGAFSVSQSRLRETEEYIAGQAEHHSTKTFAEEYESFIRAYGLSIDRGENR